MPNNILITPGSASIQFSGSAANTIRLQVEASGSIAFYGNSGSLFGISDSLSGSLMSVNDISGLPILEVFSDDRVVMGSFNKNTLVVTGSRVGIDKAIPTTDLDISGSVFITGSLRMSSGGITGSLFGTASVATSASYALSASFAPTILPSGVVSSSQQINTGSFTGSFVGVLTGTGSWAISASYVLPTGLPTGTVSSSGQVSYTGLSNVPANIVSSSAQVIAFLPAGTVSSSTQINTGSFTGSFTGTLLGTSSWASNALSASNATTSSYVLPNGLPSGIVSSSLQINTGSFSGSITSASFATTAATSSYFSGDINFPNGLDVTGSLFVTGSGLIVSGTTNLVGSVTASRLLAPSITGSLFGTSSVATSASFATTSSFAVSASWAPSAPGGGITSLTAGDGLTGGTITTTGTITLDTGSVHFLDGVKKELNTEGVVSSSLQINTGSFSGSFTGTLFGTSSWANNLTTYDVGEVITAIQGQEILPNGIAQADYVYTILMSASKVTTSAVTASVVSASTSVITNTMFVNSIIVQNNIDVTNGTINASLNNTPDPLSSRVVVWEENSGQLYITASGYGGGGGGSGNGFPFSGSAIITGSLLISSSINNVVTVQGSVNDFFEIEINNLNSGNAASSDVVASADNTTDFGNYVAMGINSTTYNGALVGAASDGYLYFTSSVGELHVGNASVSGPSNVRLFAGGPSSDTTTRLFISGAGHVGIGVTTGIQNTLQVQGNVSASTYTSSIANGIGYFGTASWAHKAVTASVAETTLTGIAITGSLTSGSVSNISELSMAVSGTIPANGTVSVTLNLNTANYFSVSGSGTGTVTWAVTNPPITGRAQTFVIEYINGGIKTNSWFTNTRWPAGIAPSLTSASANPDILSFTTDDAGSNWRGLLLQRGSA